MIPLWQTAAPATLVTVCVHSADGRGGSEVDVVSPMAQSDRLLCASLEHEELDNAAQCTEAKYKWRKAAVMGLGIITFHALTLSYIYIIFPTIDEELRQHLKLPCNIEEAKKLGGVLEHYTEQYYIEVLLAVFVAYLFMQTFAIPGSTFLSVLCGYLYKFPLALLVVCFCSATGASLCYLLSSSIGRCLADKLFPRRVSEWAATVKKQEDHLLNYLVFLRVTPFLPNWFINIVAPIIEVPLFPFWLGTFIGVAPPSFVAIQAGQTLYQLSTSNATWSWTSVLLLSVFAVLSLAPVLLKHRLRDKFEYSS